MLQVLISLARNGLDGLPRLPVCPCASLASPEIETLPNFVGNLKRFPQRTFSRCLLSSGNVSSCKQNLVVSQFQDWRVRHMGKLAVVATHQDRCGQAR